MAENNIECETCGGTDFYKESGYFYCNECQTQSQEVRDHEFEEETILAGKRKIKKQEKLDDKITSWECYNVIMFSLTEQLINLGADKELKTVVKCLWMKYLEKLEVFDLKRNEKPRLQLLNSKRDSNILYGIQSKKIKRRRSSNGSCDSALAKRRLQTKKKTELAEAQYEEFSQKSLQESVSLHNETLTSLKSSSEKSEKDKEPICFNRYSMKVLKKEISSTKHLKQHILDKDGDLQCHKLTYRNCSQKFTNSVHFLSPIKLYAILYLGLLITRGEIQLGDFLRFIREGHLTFNHFKELFPEEYSEKFLNIKNNSKNNLFSNTSFRTTAAKMAIFLGVTTYIQVVDLTSLCERFCKEMNLPDDLYIAAKNIISKVNPKLSFTSKSKIIPNYEGRAMSIILFILKLLFGLDGVTEWEMSGYAQLVNERNISDLEMFDFVQWMKYIGYRKLFVSEHYFPSHYMEESNEIDSDTFLRYIDAQGIKLDESVKLTKEMKGYKELLTKIVESQDSNPSHIKFQPTLTPYLDYSRMLNLPNFESNFRGNSLDFLIRPNKYLRNVSSSVQLKHGGANENWIIEELKTFKKMKLLSRSSLKVIPIEISEDNVERDIDETISPPKPQTSKVKLDPLYVQESYHNCRTHIFDENKTYLKRVSKPVKLNKTRENIKLDSYHHYIPYERYWLYLQMNINCINKNDFGEYFDKHTDTFKLIVKECARIIEQTTQEFLHEFQFSELFLVFAANYSKTHEEEKPKLLDSNFKHYVDTAKRHW